MSVTSRSAETKGRHANETPSRLDRSLLVTAVLTAVAAGWWTFLAWMRWRQFQFHAYDLAVIDQVVWNTSQGRWFESSFFTYNFLGQHFQPVLSVFAVAYMLGGGAMLLVVIQALAAAGAAVVLFFVARAVGLRGPVATAIALAYTANPLLHRALDYDFHPETMVALPAFAAALAAVHERRWLAYAAALTPLLFKEDAVFVTLAIAGFMLVLRQQRQALLLAGTAVAWTLLLVLVLMPAWRDGASSDLVLRYGHLGNSDSLDQIIVAVIQRPWLLADELASGDSLRAAAIVLFATAPFGLVRPWMLLGLVPGLMLALLSSHSEQRMLELHYGVELVPVASLISIAGARALDARRFSGERLAVLVATPAVIGSLWLSPFSPFSSSPLDSERETKSAEHLRTLTEALELIPGGAPVSAQSGIAPRLSHRRDLGEFPPSGAPLEWVIVDGTAHGASLDSDAALEKVRACYTQVFSENGVEIHVRAAAARTGCSP